MKTLIKTSRKDYCSEIISFKGNKFKIVAENGNCYSRVSVEIFTKNGDLGLIATQYDIPNYEYMNFLDKDEVRLGLSLKNIEVAKEFIKVVYDN